PFASVLTSTRPVVIAGCIHTLAPAIGRPCVSTTVPVTVPGRVGGGAVGWPGCAGVCVTGGAGCGVGCGACPAGAPAPTAAIVRREAPVSLGKALVTITV